MTCHCGQPVQVADDHACGECADHCRLDQYRLAEERRRLAEQVRHDEALRRIHSRDLVGAA